MNLLPPWIKRDPIPTPTIRQGRLPISKTVGRLYNTKTFRTTKLLIYTGQTNPDGIRVFFALPVNEEKK